LDPTEVSLDFKLDLLEGPTLEQITTVRWVQYVPYCRVQSAPS